MVSLCISPSNRIIHVLCSYCSFVFSIGSLLSLHWFSCILLEDVQRTLFQLEWNMLATKVTEYNNVLHRSGLLQWIHLWNMLDSLVFQLYLQGRINRIDQNIHQCPVLVQWCVAESFHHFNTFVRLAWAETKYSLIVFVIIQLGNIFKFHAKNHFTDFTHCAADDFRGSCEVLVGSTGPTACCFH